MERRLFLRNTLASAAGAFAVPTVCLLSDIAMKLSRKLFWDPEKERFINDDEANSMLSRPQRSPYGTNNIKNIG